jgi:xanthine dehydrogenase molybdenum-binding subunit
LTGEASIDPGSTDYVVNSFGAHFVKLSVDVDTGKIDIIKYVAAHDSGRIINPRMAENQVRGGVSQMLGFTLLEDMELDPSTGIPVNSSFLEHKSPTISDSPDIEVLFAKTIDSVGPFGAKSLGEPPSIGPAPAIANAIYDAVGVRIMDLPITPAKLLNALHHKRTSG